jgi:cyclic-di-AMP phosphodiesterase PgpH
MVPKEKSFINKLFTVSFPVLLKNRSVLAWAGAFLFCLIVILLSGNSSSSMRRSIEEFEVGKVAGRDLIAEYDINIEDEQATREKIETQERLIPAVFQYSNRVSGELKSRWNYFSNLAKKLFTEVHSAQSFALELRSEFPGEFSDEVLSRLYGSEKRLEILDDCGAILDSVLEKGIYSIPQTGLEHLNGDVVELIRQSDSRIEQEKIPFWAIVSGNEASASVESFIASGSFTPGLEVFANDLLKPFLKENVFYSPDTTARRVAEMRLNIEPVMRSIEQGKQIIRKGFVVTEKDMEELRALSMTLKGNDLPKTFANLLFLLMLFGLLMFFSGNRIIDRALTDSETYLVAGLSALYIAGSVLIRNIQIEYMPVSVLIPTALVMMLTSILIHPRLALMLAMTLPLGAFFTGSFNTPSFVFAIVSGVVAAYSLQSAKTRMDLVKAGLIIAAAHLVIMTTVLLWQYAAAEAYLRSLFWAAFNGIASGMLVLGILSPLEHLLNAATAFRLIELSDLNAPILRRLFTVAPGTYSHSIMVANLAEAACQDIGANSILARVGAYYHDIGKMENPGYFVENQTDYNPHDEMPPKLSATVIRSHVKLGVEKARQLGLPDDVIDIIAEHHGNSVITWFYSKALKQDNPKNPTVNVEDYRYPGNPPHSRESAVVMLADLSEAATRSISKPNAVKIEKFIKELIANKVDYGQLSQSELTFRDLEIIENAFVRVLAGYYHSRIEYPKINLQQMENNNNNNNAAASENVKAATE